jgi:hypothetical protein
MLNWLRNLLRKKTKDRKNNMSDNVTLTQVPNCPNWFYKAIDTFSLSGAIILMFFSLTAFGIVINNEKVWQNFGTALTTFVSGKKIGQSESSGK